MAQVKDADGVEIGFFRLTDRKGSGFIQDGTENTSNPIELRNPKVRYIPNEGYRMGTKVDPKTGKTIRFHEKIRFIRGIPEISVEQQKLMGVEPNRQTKEDKIIITDGEAIVARDPGNEGLFDYLSQVFYNKSAERSPKATEIFETVEPDKEAEQDNEFDHALADALIYLKPLSKKVGDGLYRYNEEKIDGLCSLFNVFAETHATRLTALTKFAKTVPLKFMQAVTLWEQITETEITHALKLSVIKFDKNVAVYVNSEKVIKSLGTEKLSNDEKVSVLADWLRTSDGYEAYNELKAHIELAKESNK
jgi:hypothetical protein